FHSLHRAPLAIPACPTRRSSDLGPGVPADAGIMPELISRYAASKDILGICLGHQAIGEAFGGGLNNLTEVVHGVASEVKIREDIDRKSTRLNSSHVKTSYAVFCL